MWDFVLYSGEVISVEKDASNEGLDTIRVKCSTWEGKDLSKNESAEMITLAPTGWVAVGDKVELVTRVVKGGSQ